MSENLYESEITGPFAALCGGNTDNTGSGETCMSLAELAGGGYAIGDTKPEGAGREALRFTKEELIAGAQEILARFGA